MQVRFIMSAPSVEGLADTGLPEVAITGRSNVGKSSLLGGLLGKPDLVRTSRTPGRTQLLNLFVLAERLALVDLPGYGYAKLSRLQRNQMHAMARNYMQGRAPLRGVVMVLDARREAGSDADREMAAWVLRCGRPLLLAVTKADLVPKTRRLHQLRQVEQAMGVPPGWAVLCSGKTQEGREELRGRLWELVSP